MKYKKELLFIVLFLNIISFLILFFIKRKFLINFLNYEIAYISFLFVMFCSYFSYKKNVLFLANNLKIEKKPLFIFLKKANKNQKIINYRIINDDFKNNFFTKIKKISWFFNVLKFFAYMIFIFSFLYLQGNFLFDIFSYLWGLVSVSIGIFFFMIFIRYEFKKNS